MTIRYALLLFSAVVALTAYPPVSALIQHGLQGAFGYLAADSFYYLSVADHSMTAPFFTFDGTHPTNGFHPLWQLYLERAFLYLDLAAEKQIWFTAISGIVLVSIGTGFFSLALLRLTNRPALALIGAVPGVFFLVTPRFDPSYGSQWSFANGMETPLSVFLFGLIAYVLFRHDPLRPGASWKPLVSAAGALTLLTLSRLDDIFIFIPFLAYLAISSESRRDAVQRVAVASVIPVVVIGGYLIFNLSYAEAALPTSGTAKSQPFWAFARNVYAVMTTAVPAFDPFGRGTANWTSEAWRVTQMLVPALLAFWWLASSKLTITPDSGTRQTWDNSMIGLLAGYVVFKSGYNFVMVSIWDQGHWYYPLTIMTFNLIAMVTLSRILDQRTTSDDSKTLRHAVLTRWPSIARLPMAAMASFMLVLVSANGFIAMKQPGQNGDRNFNFWQSRAFTQRQIDAICPGCGVLSFDDGIVSYSLKETPTLNGLGLVLDKEAIEARSDGQLLELAWQRGHRLLVSVNYPMADEAYTTPERLREHLAQNQHLRGESLGDWNFEVAFNVPSNRVSFIKFQPKLSDGK